MIGHLTILDAQMALLQQALEFVDISLNIIAANVLLTILRKFHVLSSSMSSSGKLTHRSGTDPVIEIASDLAPQPGNLSLTFCLKKEKGTLGWRAAEDAECTCHHHKLQQSPPSMNQSTKRLATVKDLSDSAG